MNKYWLLVLPLIFAMISTVACSAGDDDDDDNDDENDDDESSDEAWTDAVTGLMWQNPPGVPMSWDAAIDYCEGLSFAGHSDWRLPTISELRSLIRGCPETETDGYCDVTDDCLDYADCGTYNKCNGCDIGEGPDGGCYWPSKLNGICHWYWSSSEVDNFPEKYAWYVSFELACIRYMSKASEEGGSVRCVR